MASDRDPLAVERWPVVLLQAIETILVDQSDQQRIDAMKAGK